ncbi:class I SAM-dependent methyltransferase [Singulisphaera sp. Ch08]|uniref:Class I SAM-dependent methyltransferase n=1 Tax=Singulisphaera sp. Ch08 TaxID=3120278 RepID=A0AAU7CPL2_9BACT
MNASEYDRMFENEDHYWWFVSRRELVVDQVSRLPLPADARLLDVGCGTGAIAVALRRFGRVFGVDASPLALERCERRGLTEVVLGTAEELPVDDNSVDVIVAADILEHLDDDMAALAEFRRTLKPGGHAVIAVPAYQALWSEHDVALMHKRRYVAKELRRRVEQAGFRPVVLTYALSFLLPMALTRLLRRKAPASGTPQAQLIPVPPLINAALIRFQRLETALLRWVRLPWGLTVLAVVQKPESAASSPRHLPAPHGVSVSQRA